MNDDLFTEDPTANEMRGEIIMDLYRSQLHVEDLEQRLHQTFRDPPARASASSRPLTASATPFQPGVPWVASHQHQVRRHSLVLAETLLISPASAAECTTAEWQQHGACVARSRPRSRAAHPGKKAILSSSTPPSNQPPGERSAAKPRATAATTRRAERSSPRAVGCPARTSPAAPAPASASAPAATKRPRSASSARYLPRATRAATPATA